MKKALITLSIIVANFLTSFAQSYPEMITVEGGTFTMGDTEMEGSEDVQPLHQVTLKTFKIAKTETTVDQWKTFCNATSRSMPEAPSWGWIDSDPIVYVNYDDAVAYCNWLGKTYSGDWGLPTEAQWEFAAQGGNKSNGYTYSGSNDLDQVAWYFNNTDGKPQTVGRKKANELGIFDLNGNVWEWCKDWYDSYSTAAQTNPKGATSGTTRVLRGGGWYDPATYCRIAYRSNGHPSIRSSSDGFRVVLSQ